MEIEIKFKTDKELKEEKKKPKSISSFSDLRKLFEDEDPKLSHGEMEFGACSSTSEETKEELSKGKTPDSKAVKEPNEKRVKNSNHPTTVGKKL